MKVNISPVTHHGKKTYMYEPGWLGVAPGLKRAGSHSERLGFRICLIHEIDYSRFLRLDFILKKGHSSSYVTDERRNINPKDA